MTRMDTDGREALTDGDFAFPDQRKLPISDASHIRNAIARFDQVEGVSDADRDKAWKRLTTAARKAGVAVAEDDWRALGKG